jgi:hypothetical protein
MSCDIPISGRAAKRQNFTKFNQQTYVVHVYLCNQVADPVEINPTTIRELVIEETIFEWYLSGSMTFVDRHNVFQKRAMKMAHEFGTQPPQYKFRGDGKDILLIDIWPNWQADDEMRVPQVIDPNRWDLWLLHNKFSVYDVEDVSSNDNEFKMYKLYFWSDAYQSLVDKNLEWSTANSEYVKRKVGSTPIYRLNNDQRSVRTGEAIVQLIHEAGLGDRLEGDPWEPDNFDLGDPEASIFYTSPSKNTLADDLIYLSSRHVGEKNQDICWLQADRSTEETGEKWTLSMIPWTTLFEKAGKSAYAPGENQIEHFFIYEHGPDTEGALFPVFKAPYSPDARDRDFKLVHFNTINNYKFVDMAGMDNVKGYASMPTHHYNRGAKQFNVDFWDSKPSVAKQFIIDNYISNLYTKTKDPLLTANKSKIEALQIDPQYSMLTTLAGRKADGRNKIIANGVLLNACISFGALGLIARQPGKFIGIDRFHGDNDSDFDNRLLGQWFVTAVKHVFAGANYANHITAVKIHNFDTKIVLPEEDVK